jgi:hypothetical protein
MKAGYTVQGKAGLRILLAVAIGAIWFPIGYFILAQRKLDAAWISLGWALAFFAMWTVGGWQNDSRRKR